MGGHRRCEICGAKETWQPGGKLLYSRFPLDVNRCREWIKAVGNEELVHLPIEKLHEQRNVCADHFRKKDFNKKGNRLKRCAIPTLNLKASPLTDAQLAEFPQYMFKRSESKELNSSATEQKENIQEVQSDDCSISGDHIYSQPFYLETQNVTSSKNNIDVNDGVKANSQDDTDISQSLLQRNHNKRKTKKTQKEKNEEENIHNNKRSMKEAIEHAGDDEVHDPLCIHCTSDKKLDKKNDNFGNLLLELQALPPCMRSEAYINILNYVRSLKHHRLPSGEMVVKREPINDKK